MRWSLNSIYLKQNYQIEFFFWILFYLAKILMSFSHRTLKVDALIISASHIRRVTNAERCEKYSRYI